MFFLSRYVIWKVKKKYSSKITRGGCIFFLTWLRIVILIRKGAKLFLNIFDPQLVGQYNPELKQLHIFKADI